VKSPSIQIWFSEYWKKYYTKKKWKFMDNLTRNLLRLVFLVTIALITISILRSMV